MADILKTLGAFLVANKSSVATGIAIGGVAITAVVSGNSALKADEILKGMDEDAGKVDKIKAVAPALAPAAISALVTIGLMIFAHRSDLKAQAGLVSALAISEASKNEHVKQIMSKLDPKKAEEVEKEVAVEQINLSNADVYDFGGDILFYDEFLDRKFLATHEAVMAAVGKIALELNGLDSQNVNDLYYYIWEVSPGEKKDKYHEAGVGKLFGWNAGFDSPPYITTVDCGLIDGRPAIYLDYTKNIISDAI